MCVKLPENLGRFLFPFVSSFISVRVLSLGCQQPQRADIRYLDIKIRSTLLSSSLSLYPYHPFSICNSQLKRYTRITTLAAHSSSRSCLVKLPSYTITESIISYLLLLRHCRRMLGISWNPRESRCPPPHDVTRSTWDPPLTSWRSLGAPTPTGICMMRMQKYRRVIVLSKSCTTKIFLIQLVFIVYIYFYFYSIWTANYMTFNVRPTEITGW